MIECVSQNAAQECNFTDGFFDYLAIIVSFYLLVPVFRQVHEEISVFSAKSIKSISGFVNYRLSERKSIKPDKRDNFFKNLLEIRNIAYLDVKIETPRCINWMSSLMFFLSIIYFCQLSVGGVGSHKEITSKLNINFLDLFSPFYLIILLTFCISFAFSAFIVIREVGRVRALFSSISKLTLTEY